MTRSIVRKSGWIRSRARWLGASILVSTIFGAGAGAQSSLMMTTAAPIASILASVQGEKAVRKEDGAVEQSAIPAELVSIAEIDARAGARERVLNEMQAGVVALELQGHDYARALLTDAHEQVETIYADSATAKKARSVFTPDATKDFKGDAYERAMLGYYLGLSYLMSSDLENARAAFKWGEFQDTMSAAENYQADMGALVFLKGWIAHCQGDSATAAEEFAAAKRVRGTLNPPADQDRLLTIVEMGGSPIKVGSGKYKESLSFQRGAPPAAERVTVSLTGDELPLTLAEDVFFQAATLGGRAVGRQGADHAGTASRRCGGQPGRALRRLRHSQYGGGGFGGGFAVRTGRQDDFQSGEACGGRALLEQLARSDSVRRRALCGAKHCAVALPKQ